MDHEFLNSQEGLVTNVGISVAQKAHDDGLSVQLLEYTRKMSSQGFMYLNMSYLKQLYLTIDE